MVPDSANIDEADQRLQEFIVKAAPRLSYYVPGENPNL
jgi:hypothetical protein